MTATQFLEGMLAPLYAVFNNINPSENFVQLTVLIMLVLVIITVIIKNIFGWR
jgi:hypothetical protein